MSLAAYPIGAEYAYPWYAAWGLPMFASDSLNAFGAVVWIQSVVMLAALKLPLAVNAGPIDAALRPLLTYVAPVSLLVAFVVVGVRSTRATTVSSTARRVAVSPEFGRRHVQWLTGVLGVASGTFTTTPPSSHPGAVVQHATVGVGCVRRGVRAR